MTDFPLDPGYGYRFTAQEVNAAYPDLNTAFDDGNFCLVAECAPADSELFGAAMVMVGFPHVGLPVLERAAPLGRRASACRALALWSLDRDAEALAVLDTVLASATDDDPLQQLRRLIARRRIRIAQISSVTLTYADLGAAAAQRVQSCGDFLVERLGIAAAPDMTPDMAPDMAGTYRFDQPFDRWLDARPEAERPDLILAVTPQTFLPNGLDAVSIPKIAYQHDSDVFIDRNWDNYHQFDLSLVCTSFEHFELSRATGARCASVFQNDPIGQPFVIGTPPSPSKGKSIDLLLSGSVLDYSHPEKARFAFLLSRLADERVVRIVEGYLPAGRYAEMLATAKFLPVVSRLRGNPSPRWRDALCNGTYCLYPRDTLFARLSRGLYAYDERHIIADVREHLERHDASVPGDGYCHETAWRDVEAMYRFFAVPREKRLETVFKAMLFAHALTRSPAPPHLSSSRPAAPRVPWLMPFWEASTFSPAAALDQAVRMAQWRQTEGLRDETDHVHLGALYAAAAIIVEWRLTAAAEVRAGDVKGTPEQVFRSLIDKARAVLAAGIARFPHSLILRFNALHLRLLFALPLYSKPAGTVSRRLTGDDRARGHQLAGDVIAALACREELDRLIGEEPALHYDPRHGGLGFAPAIHVDRLIPYMTLSGDLLREAAGAPVARDGSRAIPRAALLGYRGRLAALAEGPTAALHWFSRGLAVAPTHPGLLELAVETGVTLFERGALSDAELAVLVGRAAKLCEHYPVYLFRWPGRIVDMLVHLGRTGEAAAFVEDWFRFGRSIEVAGGVPPSINAAKYRAMASYDGLLPDTERRRLNGWRAAWAADRQPEVPDNQFERFIFAALLMERLGIEPALTAARRAAIALANSPTGAPTDTGMDDGIAGAARAAREHLATLIATPAPAVALAMIAMTQAGWDPEWHPRLRQPRPAEGWPPSATAALRRLPPTAADRKILAAADARLVHNGASDEAGRWLFVTQLYQTGDAIAPALAVFDTLPGNIKLFAADWREPPNL